MKVNLMLRERCLNKLMFVKILKNYTELGLKETKEICDKLHETPYKPVEIELYPKMSDIIDKLKQDLLDIDLMFIMDGDKGFERERKLLTLGLGEKEDYISFFVEFEDLFDNQKEILNLALNKLSMEDLKEIFGKIKTKI
jgi:hypothetical protein